MVEFQVRTGFIMMWVIDTYTKRMPGMRNGQVGDKWLATVHSWVARPCWKMKVDAIL